MADSTTVEEQLSRALAERKVLTEKMLSVGAIFTDEEKTRLRVIASEIRALEARVYRDHPLPDAETVASLDLDELDELYRTLLNKRRALSQWEYENELTEEQARALTRTQELASHVDGLIEDERARSYDPGPNDPPAYEPRGMKAAPGFVKSRPENNDYYVKQFMGNPWYPAISTAHRRIAERVPNYNISQIKDKFGGLRYYYELPEGYDKELQEFVAQVIREAEMWVEGYEQALYDVSQRSSISQQSE